MEHAIQYNRSKYSHDNCIFGYVVPVRKCTLIKRRAESARWKGDSGGGGEVVWAKGPLFNLLLFYHLIENIISVPSTSQDKIICPWLAKMAYFKHV